VVSGSLKGGVAFFDWENAFSSQMGVGIMGVGFTYFDFTETFHYAIQIQFSDASVFLRLA
jgi:hypothetical protein